ncbi:MAG TPA: adenylate/guanylate cyclase domain-containing protein [Bacteroidia bacterium]|nr:adenylate/guanylate cyclase domain-containing protein [Bacteroidia bacterium]
MKHQYISCILFFNIIFTIFAQAENNIVDSLNSILKNTKIDTNYVIVSNQLCKELNIIGDYDQVIALTEKSAALSIKLNFARGQSEAYSQMGSAFRKKGDFANALNCFDKSYLISKKIGDKVGQASAINKIGITYWRQGNLAKALSSFFESLKIAEDLNDNRGKGNALGNIGLVYADNHNYEEALLYHTKALKLFETESNEKEVAASLQNIGNIYIELGKYETAIENYRNALKIKKAIGDKEGQLICHTNLCEALIQIKSYKPAELNNDSALIIANEIGSQFHIAECLNQKGKINFLNSNLLKAKKYLISAVEESSRINAINLLQSCYFNLTNVDSAMGNWQSAYEHHKLYTYYNGIIYNDENKKKITEQKMQYDFDKKEAAIRSEQEKKDVIALKELQRQKLLRNGFIGSFALVSLFAVVFFKQRNKIKKGKKRSDELLLNILPEEVAEELKAKGSADAQLIDEVTVLFTDFKGFTQLSEKLSPKELVAEINECFSGFDYIMEKYGVEKIKTIGDAYMAAGGLPTANKTHAEDVVNAALEIQSFMQEHKAKKIAGNELFFEIRIGVHTGPVVAGIVGVKKFAYDIWGDTVNTASRMESSGEIGKVNISGTTYELIKDKFNFVHRGKVQAKGKGEIDMYFVEI